MLTLPQLPPKDYYLKKINQNQISCQEHTPFSPPRVTLPTIGQFCAPIAYNKNDKIDKIKIEEPHRLVVEKWTDKSRAEWLIKPGIDDYFVHEIYKNYTIKDQIDYKTKLKTQIFPRPYRYELNNENGNELSERWQEEPDFHQKPTDNPCQRQRDLSLVGACFKNEAINWYNRNYPAPDLC